MVFSISNVRLFRSFVAGFLALAVVLIPKTASTHPHEFVIMRVTANFHIDGRLSGLTYHWTFDEFFTAYAVEGQDQNKNGKAEPNELQALLVEILGNIREIDYFTVSDPAASLPKFATPKPISAEMVDRKLDLKFNLPFTAPLDMSGKKLRFAIYDDQFYIAMNLDPDRKAVILPSEVTNCKTDIDLPDPDEDVVAFASSLGKSESSGGGLGASFAEWITISCK